MPPKPSEQSCEWCDNRAVVCTEIKTKVSKGVLGTGQFMCACHQHRDNLKRTISAKASEPKRY